MMLARVLPLPVAKEVRALLPVWLGCLAFMVAGLESGDGTIRTLVVLFYCAGSVALGALSVGHEYTHRTLPLLLAQPASRARLFMVKQLVLSVMLSTLAAAAWATAFFPSSAAAMAVMLSVLGGLFVAPWLTMLCRSPLAGTVFTIVIPGLFWLPVDGFVADHLKLVVFSRGMLSVLAIMAVLSWRTFMRLEAIEGRGQDLRLHLTGAAPVAAGAVQHPIWLLVKKELGLQQLAFGVSGVYVLGWLLIYLRAGIGEADARDVAGALTFFFSGLLAMLIGSLASAEERQLGTLEWQGLLPMASWKQWVVKVGTAMALSMVLGIGLPLLLWSAWLPWRIQAWPVVFIAMVTAAGIYVSSLCRSSMRAFLLSFPVTVVVVPLTSILVSERLWGRVRVGLTLRDPPHIDLTLGMLLAGLLTVILWLALLNHRSAERSARRVGLQVIVMAGWVALSIAVLIGASEFHLR